MAAKLGQDKVPFGGLGFVMFLWVEMTKKGTLTIVPVVVTNHTCIMKKKKLYVSYQGRLRHTKFVWMHKKVKQVCVEVCRNTINLMTNFLFDKAYS